MNFIWECKTLDLSCNEDNDDLPSSLFMLHHLSMVSLISNVMVLLIITPYKSIQVICYSSWHMEQNFMV